MKLFLWKLSQDENNSYETYDSAVVVAADPQSASMVHPARYSDTGEAIFYFHEDLDCWRRIEFPDDITAIDSSQGWVSPKNIKVVCVGEAASILKEGDVVCSSYNPG